MLHVYIDSLKKSAVKKIDTKIKEYLSENINIYFIIYITIQLASNNILHWFSLLINISFLHIREVKKPDLYTSFYRGKK